MNYPTSTGFVKNSPTSKESARILDESGRADTYKEFIVKRLTELGDHGATVDELTIEMKQGEFPTTHNGSVAGQCSTLETLFKIKKSGKMRHTTSGRPAVVYVIHDGTPYEIKRSKREDLHDDVEMCRNFLDGMIKGKVIQEGMWSRRAPEIRDLMDKVMQELR